MTKSDVKHYLLGGSNASRWMNCSGSVWLSKDLESESSKESDEGTKIHDEEASWLKWAFKDLKKMTEIDEYPLPKTAYQNFIWKNFFNSSYYDIEETIEYFPDIGGTIDFWSYNEAEKTLTIVDLKTGPVPVEPMENYQLLFYMFLLLQKHL